eukprot:2511332-Pleurochrysis_carterae.AAC.1
MLRSESRRSEALRGASARAFDIAYVRWACVTTIDSSVASSMSSASMSMSPAFSRTHCIAASVTSWLRSAPQ